MGLRRIVLWLLITKNELTDYEKFGHKAEKELTINIQPKSTSSKKSLIDDSSTSFMRKI